MRRHILILVENLSVPVLPPRCTGPGLDGAWTSFAHDTRCAGVGNLLMSTPISAMMGCADTGLTPGISARRSTALSSRVRQGPS